MSAQIYIEGAHSKTDQILCRKAFSTLLKDAGLKKMPRLTASGPRNAAFDAFKTAHASRKSGDFIAMLVDSEDPVADPEQPWSHLKKRDNWDRPTGAEDDQALLMTTCMETWIAADRDALKRHYGHKLQENALPALQALETRHRHDVHANLEHATRNCSNAYRKGKRSFEVLETLSANALTELPSFARLIRVLKNRL